MIACCDGTLLAGSRFPWQGRGWRNRILHNTSSGIFWDPVFTVINEKETTKQECNLWLSVVPFVNIVPLYLVIALVHVRYEFIRVLQGLGAPWSCRASWGEDIRLGMAAGLCYTSQHKHTTLCMGPGWSHGKGPVLRGMEVLQAPP